MSIFISIAAFRDPVLPFTLQDAYAKAAWPDELHFGVIDQSPPEALYPIPATIPPQQVSYVRIDASQARGACWARAMAMSLMGRQDWFLQIDSHMLFEQDWDATLIDKANACMTVTPDCVISSYPPAFRFVDGVATPQSGSDRLLAHVVSGNATFRKSDPVLPFQAKDLFGLGAVEGFHLGAGCLFASADFVSKFPYDPFLYFNEEEASMAVRLFTHGWTIYHVHGVPIFHLYNEPEQTTARQLPWDQRSGDDSKPLWSRLIYRARKRMNLLMSDDSSALGVYGLGTARSLADFRDFCGIDYLNRTVDPKAYSGPWDPAASQKPQAPVSSVTGG